MILKTPQESIEKVIKQQQQQKNPTKLKFLSRSRYVTLEGWRLIKETRLCKLKLTLYYTLIYPYIVYCNCAWSSTYVSNLNRIYYLQKRAVRAITNSDYRAHSAPLFSKLGILDIFSKSIRLKSPNSCFTIEITYCLHCFSIFL